MPRPLRKLVYQGILTLLCLLCNHRTLFAQNISEVHNYRDSLKKEIAQTRELAATIHNYGLLAASYIPRQLDSAHIYTKELKVLSADSDFGLATYHKLQADIHFHRDNYEENKEDLLKAITHAKKLDDIAFLNDCRVRLLKNYMWTKKVDATLALGDTILHDLKRDKVSNHIKSFSHFYVAMAHLIEEDTIKGNQSLKRSLSYKVSPEKSLELNIGIAIAFIKLKDYTNTTKYALKALKIYDNQEFDFLFINKNAKNIFYINKILGDIYNKNGELEKSLAQFDKAIAFCTEWYLHYELLRTLFNKARVQKRLGDNEGNLQTLMKGEEIMDLYRLEPSKYNETYAFPISLGYSYQRLEDYEQSIAAFERAIKVAVAKNDKMLIGNGYASLGETYLKAGDYTKARETFEKSKTFFKKEPEESMDLQSQLLYHKSLFVIDSTFKNYQKSLYHLSKYTIIRDSIFANERSDQIADLRMQYDTEKKERAISFLTKENELQRLKALKSRNEKLAFIVGLIVLGGFLILAYRGNLSKTRDLKIIQEKNKDIAKKNEENKLLVREIHHRVKNNLQIVLSLLAVSSEKLKTSENVANILLESQNKITSIALIHQNLYNSDNYIHTSSATYFDELIRNIENSYSQNETMTVDIQKKIQDVQLPMSVAVPLGLIVNELLTNSFKYAFNKNKKENIIIISFMKNKEDNTFQLHFSDNGSLEKQGLRGSEKSFGIGMIKGLVHQLNGNITIIQEPSLQYDISLGDLG